MGIYVVGAEFIPRTIRALKSAPTAMDVPVGALLKRDEHKKATVAWNGKRGF
jgi:hypothetical protein